MTKSFTDTRGTRISGRGFSHAMMALAVVFMLCVTVASNGHAQGKAIVSVGATMNMTNLLSSGLYSSSFDITFTYETLP